MKFERTEVFNFEGAFRGLRNPLDSWDKSDSYLDVIVPEATMNPVLSHAPSVFILGPEDIKLAQKLIRAGAEHRKFLRQILVSVDITAPLYWWKEFDTYKVGTVSNSQSTMHKLTAYPITIDCFEFGEDFAQGSKEDRAFLLDRWRILCKNLEELRQEYNETKSKFYWKEMVRLLPSAWKQTRTITMNYENLFSMYYQRKNHKLTEWHDYCNWIETLPYTQVLFDKYKNL